MPGHTIHPTFILKTNLEPSHSCRLCPRGHQGSDLDATCQEGGAHAVHVREGGAGGGRGGATRRFSAALQWTGTKLVEMLSSIVR